MVDFIADARMFWTRDRSTVVAAGDKDADPTALFCGVGGFVPEDQARRLGLVAEKDLTVKGRALGYAAGTPQPERVDGARRPVAPPPSAAPSTPAARD